ncbi:MAG: 2Fe-2S iron-sulfur cluster-binding protein [Acidimicrobiales bacterium]|nr:2Fe-2S iron-sulfur cluster-binding protein [Acidimicrobiales bacterium]
MATDTGERPRIGPEGGGRTDLVVDGREVEVPDEGTLLDALREHLGVTGPKDGCSPQGQCGCCTVLVDGAPRVACVTPVRRVRGRAITTADGLDDADSWAQAFSDTGASQCGFCTPGIICRLAGLRDKKPDAGHAEVEQALLAHLCRCTGWRTILDAWDAYGTPASERDLDAASERATLEGGAPQSVGPQVALGDGGFADDRAPRDALVAVLDGEGSWTLAESVAAARAAAGKVQGRRTTAEATAPIDVPDGDWDVVLQTSWVEPAYLETDSSWAGGDAAADPLANGGAFGGKSPSPLPAEAARLATEQGRAVRTVWTREDSVRLGPKRPPISAGLRSDGSGLVRVARTDGIAEAIRSALPAVDVEEVDVPGPPTSVALRCAGWAEGIVLAAACAGTVDPVTQPGGGTARASVDDDGTVRVAVAAGDPLDEVVLRSYCIGAAHQALSWVTSESIVVDAEGTVHDLTIRSFGIVRAVDTPPIEIDVEPGAGPALAVSDAVFAAVAAAVWLHQGTPPAWPTGRPLRTPSP